MAMQVLVIGASRGLGLEFAAQYRAAGAAVTATARSEEGLARLRALGANALPLDVADAASAAGLAWQGDGAAFDVVVVNAGVFGPRTTGLQTPTEAEFDTVMHTNVLGPMRLLPQVAEVLAAPGRGAGPAVGGLPRIAVLSSRMGSIGLRANASAWLYRASKAALNSVMKDAALTLQGRALCLALHPGWVRTDMGGAEADIDAATSVAGMRQTIASLGPEGHGGFFNFDGTPLAW
jgi:NAD(P)-dependent dehydrogenase (short-subunit alcohol dehydrogenase family)